METLKEVQNKLQELKNKKTQTWSKLTGIDMKNVSVINDDFISFQAESIQEVKNVLSKIKPFKNAYKIATNQPIFLTSLYMVEINNNFYKRELKISFELLNEVKIWVKIDFKNLPEEFKTMHFKKVQRALYDTETVYVNIQSHYKKFKQIRIESFVFTCPDFVSWYGGNKTLTNEAAIKDIINDILDA